MVFNSRHKFMVFNGYDILRSTCWNLSYRYSFSIQFWAFWLIIISAQLLRILMMFWISVSNWWCQYCVINLSARLFPSGLRRTPQFNWMKIKWWFWFTGTFSYLFVWISRNIILVHNGNIYIYIYIYRYIYIERERARARTS